MPTFAAIDIGANSVRLKIAKLVRHRLETIAEDREVTRLGQSVFRNGLLEPKALAFTVKVLQRFHREATRRGVDAVRMVATSALRDARNGASFVEWVRATTGWQVEIISGLEEGRLIHLGIINNLRIKASPLLLVDLGGGSCEVTVSIDGQIRSMVSLPLGAVRLTEEFLRADPPKKKEIERMREFIAEEISRLQPRMKKRQVQLTIATSGSAAALAALAQTLKSDVRPRKNFVSAAALDRTVRELAKRNLAQRKTLRGIGPRRAEIIMSGAVLYHELVHQFGLPGFLYSPLGLRDGLLVQMAADYDRGTALSKRVESERTNALLEAAKHYDIEMTYAERIRDLTLQLFDCLKNVHGLPPDYAAWLEAAAMLHEVGSYISRAGRHRHAYYVIANSEIYGYSTQQKHIIAAIARYMGKSLPTPTDRPMRRLRVADRQYVRRAVALLRMARALDQGRRGAVREMRARVRAGAVELELATKIGGADLELWSLSKERPYFREVFGRDLVAGVA